MTHEKYTELICLCIYGTDLAGETLSLAKFKIGHPEKCPACGGNVWNHFHPSWVLHDIVACENALKMAWRN
jgi:hypothetical protein